MTTKASYGVKAVVSPNAVYEAHRSVIVASSRERFALLPVTRKTVDL